MHLLIIISIPAIIATVIIIITINTTITKSDAEYCITCHGST